MLTKRLEILLNEEVSGYLETMARVSERSKGYIIRRLILQAAREQKLISRDTTTNQRVEGGKKTT